MGWMTETYTDIMDELTTGLDFPTEERPHTTHKCICSIFIVSENYWVQTFLDGEEGQ